MRLLPRRAGSTHRHSAAAARERRRSRRRARPARRLRAATRRRAASGREAIHLRARRRRRPPSAARSPPSGRTRRPSSARRRGGSVERARGTRRPGRFGPPRPSRWSVLGRRPADGDRTAWRGVPERVRIHAECAPDFAVHHAFTVEIEAWPLGHLLRPQATLGVIGPPSQREQREVALGDDIGLIARSPELGERQMLPRRRLDPLDARMQREQRGSRHAVLQTCPRRPPQRLRVPRHSRIEPTDPPSERQDLPSSEPESHLHVTLQRT
jgi:hypothetical protein